MSLPTQQLTSKRGKNFSIKESTKLIEVIWKHLPIFPDEWEEVANEHALRWKPPRTVTSVRKTFAQIHKSKKATGDPTFLVYVRMA